MSKIRGALLIAATTVLAASISAAGAVRAQPGPGQDPHYFLITVESSGEYKADYGNERLEPGQSTSFGVDGTESGSWSWKIRSVGRSVGNGPLLSSAAEFKGQASHDAQIISYTIQMGELGEDYPCANSGAWRREIISYHMPPGASGPPAGARPRWISSPDTSVEYQRGGFAVSYPSRYGLVQHCYHGLPPSLQLYSLILPSETPVSNGAFNPRSDRSFSGSWSDSVNGIEPGGAQDHVDTGSVELEISVKSVSERKARKKRDKYRDPDPQDGLYTPH